MAIVAYLTLVITLIFLVNLGDAGSILSSSGNIINHGRIKNI